RRFRVVESEGLKQGISIAADGARQLVLGADVEVDLGSQLIGVVRAAPYGKDLSARIRRNQSGLDVGLRGRVDLVDYAIGRISGGREVGVRLQERNHVGIRAAVRTGLREIPSQLGRRARLLLR